MFSKVLMTQRRNLQSTTLGWVLPEECTMAALTLQMFLVKMNSRLACSGAGRAGAAAQPKLKRHSRERAGSASQQSPAHPIH